MLCKEESQSGCLSGGDPGNGRSSRKKGTGRKRQSEKKTEMKRETAESILAETDLSKSMPKEVYEERLKALQKKDGTSAWRALSQGESRLSLALRGGMPEEKVVRSNV